MRDHGSLVAEIRRQWSDDDVEDIEEGENNSADIDHEALGALIGRGIELVNSPHQLKLERLYHDVIESAGGEKLVLFAQPIETVMALANWLMKRTGLHPAIIMGGQTDAERDQQVARFREIKGPKFLISSGWVLTAFQNAFRHLASGTPIEKGLIETVGQRGRHRHQRGDLRRASGCGSGECGDSGAMDYGSAGLPAHRRGRRQPAATTAVLAGRRAIAGGGVVDEGEALELKRTWEQGARNRNKSLWV